MRTTYKNTNFRKILNEFVIVIKEDRLKEALKGIPNIDNADGVLAFGYYDKKRGMMLEVISSAYITEDDIEYEPEMKKKRTSLSLFEYKDLDIITLDCDESHLKLFHQKLKPLLEYEPDDSLEYLREMTTLDKFRDICYIDYLRVNINLDGNFKEVLYVRSLEYKKEDDFFLGILEEEPKTDIGFHKKEMIRFSLNNDKKVLEADFYSKNPYAEIDFSNEELFEHIFKKAIFEGEDDASFALLDMINNSSFWIPVYLTDDANPWFLGDAGNTYNPIINYNEEEKQNVYLMYYKYEDASLINKEVSMIKMSFWFLLANAQEMGVDTFLLYYQNEFLPIDSTIQYALKLRKTELQLGEE